ncbi:MAG TPA: DUF4136 domain-containing protein [Terriglobia bacterium]|nr:DUF4136 domain-containing protein [Terriglobia bacterium]
MKLTKMSLSGMGLLLIFAIAVFAKVTTDYDHAADFTKYRTFSWIKEPNTRNPLMKQRIVGFINIQLNNKELRMVTNGGDLGIAAHAATHEEKTLETFYNGYPGWRWHGGWGGGTMTTVETYEVGTLVIDLFDNTTKQVIWRGVASDTISDNPEKNTKELQKVIAEMFKQFPPKAKRLTD